MSRVQRMLGDNWAMPTSVLLHGVVLAAVIFALAPMPVQLGEKAVPVTLVNLVRPALPPPVPVAIPTPPPIATTAPEVHETTPPVKKIRPKHEIKKSEPQPEVTNIAPAPEASSQPSEMPIQQPQAANPSPSYLSLLFSKLESNKVYPHTARIRKEQGTAVLRFTIDRNGHVLAYRLDKSSGHGDLDHEVEQMLARSEPFPQMPPDMTQAQLELVVPVQFSLR
jgi:periplasmic protein TonB